ncbi:MAG: hypothetical protein ABEK16_06580 [Candidatus Nanohalobium sp.]
MEKNELIDGLTEDILTYVMHGNFPERKFAESLKPTDLDSRFEEYEKLMDFHFVLREDVIEFVKNLESELRSVNTETENRSRVRRGSVDGKINWSSTIQERYSRNPGDTSLFVCENKTERYDTGENIVLKRLLSVIYNTLKDCEDFFDRNHEWSERWRDEKDLVENMKNIFERNVHVKRIKDPEEYEPTERMLNSAENSRKGLYRESARLLRKRQDIFSGDREEIRELLDKTVIRPQDEETLLELFVLFRFISTIESIEEDSCSLNTVSTGSQRIASMESEEKEIAVYHDSSARDLGIEFKYDPEKDSDKPYSRPEQVELKSREIIQDYFDRDTNQVTGRPDVILVEIIDKVSSDREFFITEVKNSTNEKTVKRGIKEALEYLAFLRDEDDFIYDGDSFGGERQGLVVVQDFEDRQVQSVGEQDGPVRIVQVSDLEDRLESLISDRI